MKRNPVLFLFVIIPFFCNSQIPDNYYVALENKCGAELKTALHNIISNDTVNYLQYGARKNHTWYGFYYTDRDTVTNLILDMYSAKKRYFPLNYVEMNFPGFGRDLNIEHAFPKSWWGSTTNAIYRDLHHLYPADASMNISKSNHPLGIVRGKPVLDNGVSKTGKFCLLGYKGIVFEPSDEYKGDFARAYFYVTTAYENYADRWHSPMLNNNTYPTWKPEALEMLLQWHRQDPVSEKEQQRQEKVFSIQHNRNPFIDYPELVEYIWGSKYNIPWTVSVNADSIEFDYDLEDQMLYIQYALNLNPLSVFIYSIYGEQITHVVPNDNRVPIELTSGVYMVVVQSKEEVVWKKFIVR